MNCQAFEPMLALYVESDLPDRAQVEAHLTRCANCRELLEDLKATDDRIRLIFC